MIGRMKKCPYCAEEIQDEAIKCKHCMEFLDGAARPLPVNNAFTWYYRKAFIVIAICSVGPFALPLIWFRPKTSLANKIILTFLVLILTWVFYRVTLASMAVIRENYKTLNDVMNGSYL